jgi:plastocyanin
LTRRAGFLPTIILLAVLAGIGCNKSQPGPQTSATPAAPAITVDPATAGSISGVVSFAGPQPKTPALDMSQDPSCPSKPQPAEVFVVKDGKLANVFVYIKEGLPQGRFAVPPEPVVLDQKGCRYIPHMLGVMTGQTLKILNSDTADHNVHDMPSNNPQWNESQMTGGPPVLKTFPNPEMMIPLQCNQHPWMRAYVNVMPHPYFAVSDADGKFTIANLPPDEYTVAAVHEKFGEQTMKVKVDAKTAAKADFKFAQGQL